MLGSLSARAGVRAADVRGGTGDDSRRTRERVGGYCRASEFFGAMGTLCNDLWTLVLVRLGDGKHIQMSFLVFNPWSREKGEFRQPPYRIS